MGLGVFPISVVERMTGLTRRRIRYYEECGLLRPSRTAGGHRLYSPDDVETLTRIRNIISSGITNMEAVSRLIALDGRTAKPQMQAATAGDAAFRLMKQSETDPRSRFRRLGLEDTRDNRHNP